MKIDKLGCPVKLPRGFKTFLLKEVRENDPVMVFERGGKVATCNKCRNTVYAETLDPYHIQNTRSRYFREQKPITARFKTEQSVICPHCGCRVTNVLRNGAGNEAFYLTVAICIQRGEGSEVWLREFDVIRNERNVYEKESDLILRETFRWSISRSDVTKYWHSSSYYNGNNGWYSVCSTWKFPDEYVFYAPEYSNTMLKGTSLQYAAPKSGWCAKGCDDTGRYLVDFVRYAAVEKLYKGGFTGLLDEKSEGADSHYGNKGMINWKARTIYKALRLPTWVVRWEASQVWTYDKLRRAKFCYKLVKDGHISKEDAEKLYRSSQSLGNLLDLCEYAPLQGCLSYLSKQKSGIANSTWLDYLNQAKQLGWDLSKKDNLYPKNLEKAHEEVGKIVKLKKNELKDKGIRERAETLEVYAFQDGDYLIRPARCYEEFVKESDELNHCVGRSTIYIDGMIEGSREIFFIRKVSDPGQPFFTLDYSLKKHHLEQCRTKNNSPYTTNQAVMDFMAKWFKKIIKDKNTYKELVKAGAAA